MQDNILKVKEVAEVCQVCPKTIYREIKRGLLPATIVGKEYRILETDLREYLDKNYLGHKISTNNYKKEKKVKISLSIDAQTKRDLDELNADKYFGTPLSIMVNKLLHKAIETEKLKKLHREVGIGKYVGL
ncbi:MAG: helix-turn-helix domain-containing protein [Clostridiales bacterium]|nr:helix-turn-helix domain-containing protein [Clostridiales bacterium]